MAPRYMLNSNLAGYLCIWPFRKNHSLFFAKLLDRKGLLWWSEGLLPIKLIQYSYVDRYNIGIGAFKPVALGNSTLRSGSNV